MDMIVLPGNVVVGSQDIIIKAARERRLREKKMHSMRKQDRRPPI